MGYVAEESKPVTMYVISWIFSLIFHDNFLGTISMELIMTSTCGNPEKKDCISITKMAYGTPTGQIQNHTILVQLVLPGWHGISYFGGQWYSITFWKWYADSRRGSMARKYNSCKRNEQLNNNLRDKWRTLLVRHIFISSRHVESIVLITRNWSLGKPWKY